MNMITEQQLMAWVGHDHETVTEMAEIITQLLNGEYTLEQLRKDIEAYDAFTFE